MTFTKPTKKEILKIKSFLKSISWWNHGAGLIVPTEFAKVLTENGITKHYSESKYL